MLRRTLAIAVSLVAIAVPAAAIGSLWLLPDSSAEWLNRFADGVAGPPRIAFTVGAGALIALAVALLAFEIPRRRPATIRLGGAKDGPSIALAEIDERIRQDLSEIPHLTSSVAVTSRRGRKLAIELDLYVDPDAMLAESAEAAAKRARQLIESKIGVPLAAPPMVRLHYRELRFNAALEPPATQQVEKANEDKKQKAKKAAAARS